jgi:hypothetical protein
MVVAMFRAMLFEQFPGGKRASVRHRHEPARLHPVM